MINNHLQKNSRSQGGANDSDLPLTSCRFGIEIDNTVVGIFQCGNLQTEIEEYSYKEGGMNKYLYVLPGRIKYQHIILKKGVTISSTLWDWYKQSLSSRKGIRRNVSIILFNERMEEVRRWNFKGCWPQKWLGPDLKADRSDVAIEIFELAHEGFIEEGSVSI
ncbi:MAG: phage tail protein [bacterium]